MGIPGLLKILKPYTEPVHVKRYSGKRVGIDAYCLLHKGAYACSFEICEHKLSDQSSMPPFVKYCMHRINLLRFNNVFPVVVFDGGRLPLKAATEDERQRRRDMNFEQARLKLSIGDVSGAEELYQRAVEITPAMAYELIKVLKAEAVEFVVAPYEADAQLAYLSSLDPERGGIAAVISEDSDLLAYGCDVVMYKMDRYGNGEEVRLLEVLKNAAPIDKGDGTSLSFGCFTKELFTGMCVLAGCDFLPSVPGIGIKRAHGLVSKYRNLCRVLSKLRFDAKLVVPEGYGLAFKQANAIFHHARVYDSDSKKLSFLNPLPANFMDDFNGNVDFLGPEMPASRACAVAEGRLDPIFLCTFDGTRGNCYVPELPQARLELIRDKYARNSSLHFTEGGVRTEPGDELQTALALQEVVESGDALPATGGVSESGAVFTGSQADNAFTAHLKFLMSNASLSSECILEEHRIYGLDRASQTSPVGVVQMQEQELKSVIECPGQKRVFPPAPDNNPFKKIRSCNSTSYSLGERSVTRSELVETLIGKPSAEISATSPVATSSTSSAGCNYSQAGVSSSYVGAGSALRNPSIEPLNTDGDLISAMNLSEKEKEERQGRKGNRSVSCGKEEGGRRAVAKAGWSKVTQTSGFKKERGISSRSKHNKMVSCAPGLLKFFHRVATL